MTTVKYLTTLRGLGLAAALTLILAACGGDSDDDGGGGGGGGEGAGGSRDVGFFAGKWGEVGPEVSNPDQLEIMKNGRVLVDDGFCEGDFRLEGNRLVNEEFDCSGTVYEITIARAKPSEVEGYDDFPDAELILLTGNKEFTDSEDGQTFARDDD